MALDNSTTLNVDNVAFYAGPKGLVAPTGVDLSTFDFVNPPSTVDSGDVTPVPLELIGHTSNETEVTLSSSIDGNETIGSKQRAALRQTRARATYALTFAALQFDNRVLSLLFGGGRTDTAGQFGISKEFVPQERSIFPVLSDSEAALAWFFSLASIVPDGDVEFGDEQMNEVGLRCSILDDDNATDLGIIFRDGLGA